MAEFRTTSGLIDCDVYVRTASGLVLVDPQFRNATVLVDCGSGAPLSAVASPDYVSGAIDRSKPGTVTTNITTASPSGGRAPYTYEWTELSGELTISDPSSASTYFSGIVAAGDQKTGTFTCTITDAAGATAVTNIVTATVENLNGGPLS